MDPPCTSSDSPQEKVEALKKALESAEKKLAEKQDEEEQQAKEEEEALKKAEGRMERSLEKGKNGHRPRSTSRKPVQLTTAELIQLERLHLQLEKPKIESNPSKYSRAPAEDPLKKGESTRSIPAPVLVLLLALQRTP